MPAIRVLLMFGLFVGLSTAARADDEVVKFSSLRAGDEVVVKLTSSGCFHYNRYEFRFRRGERLSVEIDYLPINSESGRNLATAKLEHIGKLVLTEAEIADVDRMLEYYRAKPPVMSTNRNEVSVSYHRAGDAKPRTELLIDSNFDDAGDTKPRTKTLTDADSDESEEANFLLLGLIGTIRMQQELPGVKLK